MLKLLSIGLAIAAGGASLLALASAQAQPAPRENACFNVNQIQNSRLASPRVLLIRLGGGVYYEMDFGADCDVTDSTLVLHPVDNSGQVCGAVSVNVGARGGGGLCIPTRLHRLTPPELESIPRKSLP